MKIQEELISVIMGIYNISTKEVLKASINSILNQTYKNIEFIIIDDGSTNDTYEWAKDLTKKDKRVNLLKNEKNIGLAKTLNKALELSKGKYIARMDGDDISHLDRLEKQMKYLKENKQIQMVSCNINRIDDSGIWGEGIFPENISKNDFLFTSPIVHPTILGYKYAFDQVLRI